MINNFSIGQIVAISVFVTWVVLLIVFLLTKDIKDRKYNKVLKTKDQMIKEDGEKFVG